MTSHLIPRSLQQTPVGEKAAGESQPWMIKNGDFLSGKFHSICEIKYPSRTWLHDLNELGNFFSYDVMISVDIHSGHISSSSSIAHPTATIIPQRICLLILMNFSAASNRGRQSEC